MALLAIFSSFYVSMAVAQMVPLGGCLQGEVSLKESVKLAPTCKSVASVTISTSGVTLDCQGSTIDVGGKWLFGVLIDSHGQAMRDVTIKNCHIINARNDGIRVGWSAPGGEKAEKFSHEEIYAKTPQRVHIIDVTVVDSGRTGLYVDDYVQDLEAKDIEISGSGDVGIYLEYSSRRTMIDSSKIFNNGFKYSREGIAVDSSADNRISHSAIFHNASGGIFIYRNCSEFLASDPVKEAKRWQSADRNVIESNEIYDGSFGIMVASRQSADLSKSMCGNGYYALGKYTLDSAKHNKISGNHVADVDYGVFVEDDFNEVVNNRFERVRKRAIQVGSSPMFEYLHKSVTGVRVSGNDFKDGSAEIRFIGGAENASASPAK